MSAIAAGAVPSPNIWRHADVYEIENRALDPDGIVSATMRSIRPWAGSTILDVGCGSGFHLPGFAAEASSVLGVEPHRRLLRLARRRTDRIANVAVRQGSAQALPLPAASVDIAHARWAYFFGPGCEPGLRELNRVVRRGGVAFIVDNDPTDSTFGRWFASAFPGVDSLGNDRFFSRHGWTNLRRRIRVSFGCRADFESVVRIEFPAQVADRVIADHRGLEVDYAIMIRVRHF